LLNFEAVHEHGHRSLTIGLDRSSGTYDGMPGTRELTLVIHNWDADVDTVTFDGAAVPMHSRLQRRGTAYRYDEQSGQLTVKVTWDHEPAELIIKEVGR
jgi:oligosaccharide 4-alpha-D-glucosyltransferase